MFIGQADGWEWDLCMTICVPVWLCVCEVWGGGGEVAVG